MKKGQDRAMAKGGLKMKTVAELLKAKPARVVSVRPEQSVLEAIKVLAAEDIGAAIVMTGGRLVGILSERDYTRKVVLKARSSDTTRVEEIMTPNVIVVNPRTKTRECMALMTERNIRHLPVLDEGRVIGMISIRDIVGDIIADQDFTIEQLEHYISGQ
jgi:CBS domain-containing protein